MGFGYHWTVIASDGVLTTASSDTFSLMLPIFESIDQRVAAIPPQFVLYQNYPNPFNPLTTIRFGLPEQTRVKIEVYNLQGQMVHQVLDDDLAAGYHVIQFHADQLSSGLYFYKIETAHFREIKKMLLMK
jgi:hypothetical protein